MNSRHNIPIYVAGAILVAIGLIVGSAAFAGNDTYQYDAYGRLTSITYADGSTITYVYDVAGNRTTLTQTP